MILTGEKNLIKVVFIILIFFFYIFREHSFSEIISHCNNLKDLVGPVYDVGHAAHTFSEMKKHVESLKTLMGPIYGDERHK